MVFAALPEQKFPDAATALRPVNLALPAPGTK